MERGKNFNVFLLDGTVTGRVKCTLANWTGLVYKIPRKYLKDSGDRPDLKQSGVYFLFGKDENEDDAVYIGQAGIRQNGEGVLFRVAEHLKNDDDPYFTDAVMLTTQNNSFGPTEISYLENRFTNMALEANRYHVTNHNNPNPGNTTEEKESELEEFIDYARMALGVLGYKVFVPILKKTTDNLAADDSGELPLYLAQKTRKSDHTIEARCKRTDEGFVVLAGSMIEEKDSPSVPTTIAALRARCQKHHEIVNGRIIKDYLFKSPSYAASFVLGMSRNGRTDWKTAAGITLKDLEEKEV